ncbi:hypothetical protein IPJ63_03750 [Candidatus Nomurabacteria bacterium]|nr:MAG: hypothetical protein IPJ63_03750 [Candidatus Nomurabacteria bacterium]
MKKDLKYLNSKWWYRLMKVLIFSILVYALVGIPIAVFDSYAPRFDYENSYISCANGKTFSLKNGGIYAFSDNLGAHNVDRAIELCVDVIKSSTEVSYVPVSVREALTLKYGTPSINSGKYEFVAIYTDRNWIASLSYSIMAIMATLLIFELIRRVFYYIVLGSFFPDNPKKYFMFKLKDKNKEN